MLATVSDPNSTNAITPGRAAFPTIRARGGEGGGDTFVANGKGLRRADEAAQGTSSSQYKKVLTAYNVGRLARPLGRCKSLPTPCLSRERQNSTVRASKSFRACGLRPGCAQPHKRQNTRYLDSPLNNGSACTLT